MVQSLYMGEVDGSVMQVGDLVLWVGKINDNHIGESLHGIVVGIGDGTNTDCPWCRVHWFEDNTEYNYVIDDTDIRLVEK